MVPIGLASQAGKLAAMPSRWTTSARATRAQLAADWRAFASEAESTEAGNQVRIHSSLLDPKIGRPVMCEDKIVTRVGAANRSPLPYISRLCSACSSIRSSIFFTSERAHAYLANDYLLLQGGNSSLHRAVNLRKASKVQEILDAGKDVNAINKVIALYRTQQSCLALPSLF